MATKKTENGAKMDLKMHQNRYFVIFKGFDQSMSNFIDSKNTCHAFSQLQILDGSDGFPPSRPFSRILIGKL